MLFDQVEERGCSNEDVAVIQTRNRVIDEEVRRLLICPALDLEEREKEAPNKHPLFASRNFDGDFRDVAWIVCRSFLVEEKHGLDAVFRILMGDELKPIA